jgi:hypothetical protein
MDEEEFFPPPPPVWAPKFYAHYNADTGNIVSISNEKLKEHTHSIEITYTEYENFTLGISKILDFKVENDQLICINVKKPKLKNKKLKEISSNKLADIEVYYTHEWTFLLNDHARQNYYDKKIIGDSVQLYLTLKDNRDYIIRTFNLPFKDLILDKIIIPFESNIEEQDNLSLLTNSDLAYNLIR